MLYQALSSSRFDLFNISLTDGVDWKSFHHDLLSEPASPVFLTKSQQEELRYQIIAEGECQWASRLRDALFMGNVLIIQDYQCIEFYGIRLVPWVHYIPVDYWFLNLTEAVLWAENNQQAVHKMNAEKLAYAKQYLSPKNPRPVSGPQTPFRQRRRYAVIKKLTSQSACGLRRYLQGVTRAVAR